MTVQFLDLLKEPALEAGHSKKVLFSSEHFHTWVHGDWPGTKGPMHKHTADQFFYCVQGQCTFRFPDGTAKVVDPGGLMVIPRDHLYQLDNTGDDYMILLGARAEPAGNKRFSAEGAEVGHNDYAARHPERVKAPTAKN